jgi:hypothetical protein
VGGQRSPGSWERRNRRGDEGDRHQAHHLVTDAIVRDSPLFLAARERGVPPYDVDTKSNGIWLPDSPDARTSATKNLPVHSGSHGDYSKIAMREAEREAKQLEARSGRSTRCPPRT